jgi:sulfate transport system ATP-binding protein
MNHGKIEQVGSPADVYDHPANAFVYQFLGDVNLFVGRADDPSAGFVRPHELEIAPWSETENGAIPATIRYIATGGPVVRLELLRDDSGSSLDVEISLERFRDLPLRVGDKVGVTPRNLRVFAKD